MGVWLQGNRWRYKFQHESKNHQGYCIDPDTGEEAINKTEAKRIRDHIRVETKRLNPKISIPVNGYSFAECLAYYWQHHGKTHKNSVDIASHIKELLAFFGGSVRVEDIKRSDVKEYIEYSRAKPLLVNIGGAGRLPKYRPRKNGGTRSDSRTNRYLGTLRVALKMAVDDEFAMHCCKIKNLKEPKEQPNPISLEGVKRLMDFAPLHLKFVILLCVYTGMRESECLGLKWFNVKWERKMIVLGSGTKSNQGRTINLTKQAIQALKEINEARDPKCDVDNVILWRGKAIKSIDRAWINARTKANLESHHTFHNTRDTFASYHLNSGTDVRTLQKMMGHKDIKTTMRYADAEDGKMKEAAANLGAAINISIDLESLQKVAPFEAKEETAIH